MKVRRWRIKGDWMEARGYIERPEGLLNHDRFENLQAWLAGKGHPIPTGVTVFGAVQHSLYAVTVEFSYADDVVPGSLVVKVSNYPRDRASH